MPSDTPPRTPPASSTRASPSSARRPRIPAIIHRAFSVDRVTYQLRSIDCGKASCSRLHGPYWYAFQRIDAGRRTRTICTYVGRALPDALRALDPG